MTAQACPMTNVSSGIALRLRATAAAGVRPATRRTVTRLSKASPAEQTPKTIRSPGRKKKYWSGRSALPSKTIILGVLDLADPTVERADEVAARIRRALAFVPAERILVAPDCGMKYLPHDIAFGKMQAMAAGAAIVRREIENRTSRNAAG